jgi:uncharacterized Ntn-hydrolase superfamily protein
VHTFSIVAFDPATGEMGVAVQSHWFAVGGNVTWAEAGVGAVATQSFIDPSYGPLGLNLMRAGKSAPDALRGLLMADDACNVRQVAMVDAQGRVATFTGAKDIQPAGGIAGAPSGGAASTATQIQCGGQPSGAMMTGKNYAVQANLMINDRIWPSMSKAYESTKGDLAERMLAALDAAQAAGGDVRGRQSAAIVIVPAKGTGKPWQDYLFNLRVDDSAEPLKELRRLVTLQRAYNHMNAGDKAVELHDNAGALREYGAAEQLVPDNAEMIYWHAIALANMGRVDESLPLFKKVFALDRNWVDLTPRLPKAGLLPEDPQLIQKIVAQAK